jgi:hypothetical protein
MTDENNAGVHELSDEKGERLLKVCVSIGKLLVDIPMMDILSILSSVTAKTIVLGKQQHGRDIKKTVGDFSTLLLHTLKSYEEVGE